MREFWILLLIVFAWAIITIQNKNPAEFTKMEHVQWESVSPYMYHELEQHIEEKDKRVFKQSFKEFITTQNKNGVNWNWDRDPDPIRETRKEAGPLRAP